MRTDESDDRDSGVGAVANPYAITVFADTGLTVNFTLAIAIVDGQTQIIPGVQVLPAATTPLTTYPDIQAQLQGAIQIATITLGVGTLSAEPFPSFGVLLRVGNSQPNGLLMSAEALSVGAAQVGVTYTAGAASPLLAQLRPPERHQRQQQLGQHRPQQLQHRRRQRRDNGFADRADRVYGAKRHLERAGDSNRPHRADGGAVRLPDHPTELP